MSHLPNLVQWGSYYENPFPLVRHHEGCIKSVFLTALLHKGVMRVTSELLQGSGGFRTVGQGRSGEKFQSSFLSSANLLCLRSLQRQPPWVQFLSPQNPLRVYSCAMYV